MKSRISTLAGVITPASFLLALIIPRKNKKVSFNTKHNHQHNKPFFIKIHFPLLTQ